MLTIANLTQRIRDLDASLAGDYGKQAVAAVVNPRSVLFFKDILESGTVGRDGIIGLEEEIDAWLSTYAEQPSPAVLMLIRNAIVSLCDETATAPRVIDPPAKVIDLAAKSKPKGFEGLKEASRVADLSMYYSNILTPRQRDCFSLKHEYGKPIAEIARRLGISRTMVQKHLRAAKGKIEHSKTIEQNRRQVEKNRHHRDT